jgi:hypothetical protein
MSRLNSRLSLPLAALLALTIYVCGCAEEEYDGYSFGKVHLDLTSDEAVELYPDRGLEAELKWMRDFDTGMVICRPKDGATDREDIFVLLENKVMQFNRREPLDEESFSSTVAELKRRYGEPTSEPPHFARYNSYLRSIKDSGSTFEEIYFWGDEEQSAVMSASYSKAKNEMYFLIFDPRRYNRIDQQVRENNERRQQLIEHQRKLEEEKKGAGAETPPAAGDDAGGEATEPPAEGGP